MQRSDFQFGCICVNEDGNMRLTIRSSGALPSDIIPSTLETEKA
jgi:hypothetical protein